MIAGLLGCVCSYPVTLIVITLVTIYLLFLRESKTHKLWSRIPGPPTLPLLGNALELKDPEFSLKHLLEWRAKYGKRYRFKMGLEHFFLSVDVKDMEKLLTSNEFIEKAPIYDFIGDWLGRGNLLLSGGKHWHGKRKILTPAFHFKILDTFQPIFHEQSKVFVEVIGQAAKNGSIDIEPFITRCTLDIICETAMGKKLNCQRDVDNAFANATATQTWLFWQRFTKPWLNSNFLWSLSSLGRKEKKNLKVLHDFADQVIKERKEEYFKFKAENKLSNTSQGDGEDVFLSSKKRFAFLDLLIRLQDENNPASPWSDRDLREETDTFMFEGHDTTAAATIWSIYLLGLYPEQQAELHEELDSIFGDDRDRPITVTDLTQMKFLECCVKEALRIYPSVPLISRLMHKDFQLDEKTIIPMGTQFMITPLLLGREVEFYPEPEEFRPSRFSPENSSKRHPYAYIPFSAGPRNCIGQRFAYMEEKTLIGNLFRNFKVESLQSREEVKPLTEVILKPKNGLLVKLTPR